MGLWGPASGGLWGSGSVRPVGSVAASGRPGFGTYQWSAKWKTKCGTVSQSVHGHPDPHCRPGPPCQPDPPRPVVTVGHPGRPASLHAW
jgi:hypothetical protein